jgi:ABC-type amino acid transport substrate-binding protein
MKALIVLLISMTALGQGGQTIRFLKQNSQPKYFEESSKRLGLCDEIYFLIKKELVKNSERIHIDEKLYPIKRILSMLTNGRAHVFCGAGRNEKRERLFIYSKLPVYHVSNVVAAKKSETFTPQTYEDLVSRDIVVGAYHGTSSARFLKKYKGMRLNDSYTSFQQAFKELAHTNLRFFYYHDLGLNHMIPESGYPLKVVSTKFRTIPQWLIYSKKTPKDVVDAIERAIKSLHDKRVIHKVWEKYF